MTHYTPTTVEEVDRPETLANPPPAANTRANARLFQNMEELHERHGNTSSARELALRMASSVLIGLAVFGVLYFLILFGE